MKFWRVITITSSIFMMTSNAFAQGSLTPPPGSPAPTMKTLEQVEPRTDLATVAGDATYHHVITNAGSYYMSSNLEVTNSSGIYITASGVTLDLNGFEISSASGSGGYGIHNIGTPGVTVRNGTIVGFAYGIETFGPCLLEKLVVSECSSYGIHAGSDSRIINCQAHNNTGSGIYSIKQSILNGCMATYNSGDYGIYAGTDSTLSSCSATRNSNYGIYAAEGSSLSRCAASYNQNSGIRLSYGCIINGCTASYNQYCGIQTSSSCTINDSTASSNSDDGFSVGYDCSLNNCTAIGNSADGIDSSSLSTPSSGSSFSSCTAIGNSVAGIATGHYATLRDCKARGNTIAGIRAGVGSSLSGCTASQNMGSWGIYADSGSSLSGCTASHNECSFGITVAGEGASLSGCSAFDNTTDYGIHAGDGASLTGCTAYNNEGTGWESYGIYAGSGSTVVECAASGNSNTNSVSASFRGVGIYVRFIGTVKDCITSFNSGDGIWIDDGSVAQGNTCTVNGHAGIHADSTASPIKGNCRIIDNTVKNNDYGIEVDDSGGQIVRNSASNNGTNYVIAAGNDVGTIQTSSVGAGAWDNFEF